MLQEEVQRTQGEHKAAEDEVAEERRKLADVQLEKAQIDQQVEAASKAIYISTLFTAPSVV